MANAAVSSLRAILPSADTSEAPQSSAFDFAYAAYISSINNNPSIHDKVTNLAAGNPSLSPLVVELLPPTLDPGSLLPTLGSGSSLLPPTYISNFPSSVQSFLQSIYSIEVFIATEYGLITVSTVAASTSTQGPTASAAFTSSTSSNTDTSTSSISFPTTSPATRTSFITTTASTASTSSSRGSAAISSSAGDSTSISGGGLSSSARIGIGVGVTLGGLFILLLTFMVIRLMRRTRQLTTQLEERKMMEPGVAMAGPEAEPGIAISEQRQIINPSK